jgi:hypothetical protein
MNGERPLVELLYFDGCPGIERVLPIVGLLAEASGARVIQRRIETSKEAEAQRFLGSPTVRVDGIDVEPGAEERDDFGLKCRLYQTVQGLAGVPDADWVRDALGVRAASRVMTDTRRMAITDLLGEGRWADERIAGLGPHARRLYGLVLYRFAQGRPPDGGELRRLGFGGNALSQLVTRDLVALDPAGEIVAAYPFSAAPTRHRVVVEDGQAYWTMCAIDALGVPYLLHQAAEIHAREPGSGHRISIAIDPHADSAQADATEAVVVVARSSDGCAARCLCPHTNVFGSRAAAERHLAAAGLHGTILDLRAAIATGQRLFGDLLDRLGAGVSG